MKNRIILVLCLFSTLLTASFHDNNNNKEIRRIPEMRMFLSTYFVACHLGSEAGRTIAEHCIADYDPANERHARTVRIAGDISGIYAPWCIFACMAIIQPEYPSFIPSILVPSQVVCCSAIMGAGCPAAMGLWQTHSDASLRSQKKAKLIIPRMGDDDVPIIPTTGGNENFNKTV